MRAVLTSEDARLLAYLAEELEFCTRKVERNPHAYFTQKVDDWFTTDEFVVRANLARRLSPAGKRCARGFFRFARLIYRNTAQLTVKQRYQFVEHLYERAKDESFTKHALLHQRWALMNVIDRGLER